MSVRLFWRSVVDRGRKLLHATSTPHQIALGFVLGLAPSMVPVPFLGLALGIGLAALLRANLVAAYLGTAVMNPVTAPFVCFAELWVGLTIFGETVPEWSNVSRYSGAQWLDLLQRWLGPFATGIAVMVIAATVVGYPLAYLGMRLARTRRRTARATAVADPKLL